MALFCDMHFGEHADTDEKTIQFESTMIELENPDLIVVDGDASSNYASPDCSNASACVEYYMDNWKKFTGPLEDAGVPYAYALGNHDRIGGPGSGAAGPGNESDYLVSDHWIMQVDKTSHVALSQDGPQDIHGASNYAVPINGADGKPAFYVWVLDSSDDNCLGTTGWGCVYPDQVAWFRQKSADLRAQDGRVVPGMAFLHIPLPEVMEAWDRGEDVNGTKGEDVCCFSENTGLFTAMVEMGNIVAALSGHDHGNDFIGRKDGIVIGYGRKSGHGGYGSSKVGARMVELTEKAEGGVEWQTYIRLESGERIENSGGPLTLEQRGAGPQGICGGASEAAQAPTATAMCRLDGSRSACRAATGLSEETDVELV